MAGLLIMAMSLGLLLVNCGSVSEGDSAGTHGLKSPGDLETLSNDASMKSQPHYQHLEILPNSYIQNAEGTSKQALKGDANIIYSRYTGDVSPKYSDYDVYKYESTFNLIKIANNSTGKLASCYLLTEMDDGEYSLGICNPDDPNETAWEDTPVLSDFKTFEVGATHDYNSSFERGSFTVLAKEYVAIDNIKYPAWKIHETSDGDAIYSEEYRWVNPQYGILKVQTTMISHEDGSIMFLDGVLRECR
jgi:hypothetical protein